MLKWLLSMRLFRDWPRQSYLPYCYSATAEPSGSFRTDHEDVHFDIRGTWCDAFKCDGKKKHSDVAGAMLDRWFS